MKCLIDNSDMEIWDKCIVLGKYSVNYYKCKKCGIIKTQDPFWLDEAYSDAITDSDIGLVSRNIENSHIISAILNELFPRNGVFLDWGGGYGMFVRMMRDRGFNFEWYDLFCSNIFAKGFERKKTKYDAITAFELMEHLENPIETLDEMFMYTDNVIFSTMIYPEAVKNTSEWWYFSLETGQHITIYSSESLSKIAKKLGKRYVSCENYHIMSGGSIDTKVFKQCCNDSRNINSYYKHRRESLLARDYEAITGKKL